MAALNKCPRCGFELPPNQTIAHMEDQCIRLIAGELHAVKEAAARTAAELEKLKSKYAEHTHP
jgi:hypothetical protein